MKIHPLPYHILYPITSLTLSPSSPETYKIIFTLNLQLFRFLATSSRQADINVDGTRDTTEVCSNTGTSLEYIDANHKWLPAR